MSRDWDGIDDEGLDDARLNDQVNEMRGRFCVPLREAIDLFNERYDVLRRERPDDFVLPDGDYGRNVYT